MGANVSTIFAFFGNTIVYMVGRDKEKPKKAAVRAGKSVKADSITSHLIDADYTMLMNISGSATTNYVFIVENNIYET